jgi:hypothetical protein
MSKKEKKRKGKGKPGEVLGESEEKESSVYHRIRKASNIK